MRACTCAFDVPRMPPYILNHTPTHPHPNTPSHHTPTDTHRVYRGVLPREGFGFFAGLLGVRRSHIQEVRLVAARHQKAHLGEGEREEKRREEREGERERRRRNDRWSEGKMTREEKEK